METYHMNSKNYRKTKIGNGVKKPKSKKTLEINTKIPDIKKEISEKKVK